MRKILPYFFELRFLPNISTFLFNNETWLRLRPLKIFFQSIDPDKKKRIVDIGGGSGWLELALKRTDVYIYDANQESIAIAKKYFNNAIVGSGARIEFDDDSFDWAISIHTLEHILKNDRERFILEMVRISKEGVYLNFPEGEYAAKLCKNFLSALDKNGEPPNKWTVEHLEMKLPKIDEIDEIIKKQDKFVFKYIFIRNYNAENHYWTKNRAANNVIKSYFLSPVDSLMKYLNYKKLPTVELILIGSKTEAGANELLRKF
jgi:ubiquinone/menaquinone biosynthesis C-methylase UbiE